MGVVFKSNLDLVLRQIHENNDKAAEKAGEIAVEGVQDKILYGYHDWHGIPPHTEIVDTGALFDSIAADVRKESQNTVSVSVGSDVHYSIYVHEGYKQPAGLKFQGKDGNWYTTKGRRIKGRPFLTDGLESKKTELENAVGVAWKNGF